MWACCADSSSDDDEHNTNNNTLLLSRLSALDELSLALTCRFALDIFTTIQQDYPEGLEVNTSVDLELNDLA